jgi:hypothetical protein
MHSLNSIEYAKVVAAERAEHAPQAIAARRHRAPPVRAAAHVAARLARRLDADVARRAIA